VGDFFADRDALKAFYADTVERYLDLVRERTGAAHLVLKDPGLTADFPHVHELLPDARFAVIIRHPLDVCASMVRVGRRLEAMGEWSPFEVGDVGRMCGQYLGCYGPLADAQNRSESLRRAVLWVRYEDLVGNSAPVLKEIAKFTGLACERFDPEAEWRMFSRRVFQGTKRQEAFPTELSGRGISKDSVGRFGDVLTAEDCAIIARECREAIHAFGYDAMPAFRLETA
ncbi:MAG: sulfotransferase, partial [Rhodospirillales bacterium]